MKVTDEKKETVVDDRGMIVYDGRIPDDIDIFADDIQFGLELPVIAAIVAIVIALASIGYTIYAYVTAPGPPDSLDPNNAFGFGLRNSFNPDSPIPVIYGTHKVSGQYFFQQMSNLKTNNLLSIGIGLGEGPIESISEIKVNNILMEDIQSGAQVGNFESFLGDFTMPSSGTGGVANIFYTPGFTQDFNDEIPLDGGTITRTTLKNNVTRLDVGFLHNLGIFQLNDEKGKIRAFNWKMEIDYRKVGDDDWIEGPRIKKKFKNSGAFRQQYFIAQGLEPGQYQVRLTHNTKDARGDPVTADTNLDFLSEGVAFETNKFEVGNFAYLALNLEATGTIAGSPLVTSVIKGRTVDVYTDTTTSANFWSDNPAWCILDFLTNPRYGLGNFITLDNIDIQSFIDVATFCAQSDTNGARKGRLDLVMNSVRPALDWLEIMLKSFGGFLQLTGGLIAIGVDKDEASVQLFDESNILAGSLQYDMSSAQDTSRVNRINVTYRNREKDYSTDTFRLEIDSEITTESDVIEINIQLFGVTRPLDVERQARRLLNILRTNIRRVEFDADISTVQVRVGDVISVTHGLPGWSSKKFRIVNIEENPEQTRKVTALEHNASVYTVEDTVVTAVANTNLFNPFLPASGVTSVDLVPEFSRQIDGTIQNNLDVSWDYPPEQGAYLGLDSFEIFYSAAGPEEELVSGTNFNPLDTDSIFHVTESGTVLSGTIGIPSTLGERVSPSERFFEIQNVETDIFVHVQVLPVTTSNARRIQENEPVFSTFFPSYSGQPSNSDVFSATLTNEDVFLSWSEIPNNEAPDLAGFEVRTEDANFGVDDSNLVFRGSSLSAVDKDPGNRENIYYLRAFNNSQIYSVASVSDTLSGTAPNAVVLNEPTVEGANVFLSWGKSFAPATIGYEVHVSGTQGFTPSPTSLVGVLDGEDSTTFRFQDERNVDGDYAPKYFGVAPIDFYSQTFSDQNYSNEVAASGEDLVSVSSATGGENQTWTESTAGFLPVSGTEVTIVAVDRSIVTLTYRGRHTSTISGSPGASRTMSFLTKVGEGTTISGLGTIVENSGLLNLPVTNELGGALTSQTDEINRVIGTDQPGAGIWTYRVDIGTGSFQVHDELTVNTFNFEVEEKR